MTEDLAQRTDTLDRPVHLPRVVRPLLPQLQPKPKPSFLTVLVAAFNDAFEHRRLIVLLPICMIAGLLAYAALPAEPASLALGGVALAMAATLVLLRNRFIPSRIATLLATIWLGFCLLPAHSMVWGTQMLPYPAYGAYAAHVDEVLTETTEQRRLIISQITPLDTARPLDIQRARIIVAGGAPIEAGDTIRANLRLAPVPGPILPGAFDGQFHAHFAGIAAYGNVTSNLAIDRATDSTSIVRLVDGIRRGIGQRLDQVIDGAPAAIAWAMVVGDQSYIDDDTREIMAASGLAHIYSISGLHLSIVAGGVFFLARFVFAAISGIAPRLRAKKLAAALGIVAACGYLLLAGGTANIPAFRSTIMLVLIFGAVLAGRHALTMRNVAFAAILIILIDPTNVFRASFQLSFAAVVALIGVYELPRKAPPVERGLVGRWSYALWGTALTSLIAGTATVLFSAYHFQQTAPLGVLGNVMALPVLSFVIMPMGALSVLAMPFGIEAPFVTAMGWGIERMLDVARLVTAWSNGLETNPILTPGALIIGLFALGWFAFLRSRLKYLGPAIAVPLLILFGFDDRPDILIADTTQAVAIRNDDTMALIAGQTGSFAVDVWSDHFNTEIAPSHQTTRCDELACILDTDTFSVSRVTGPEAFWEDCRAHDLVVTRLYAPDICRTATQVVDAGDLAEFGVHWLRWLDAEDRFEVRTAIVNTERPWRP